MFRGKIVGWGEIQLRRSLKELVTEEEQFVQVIFSVIDLGKPHPPHPRVQERKTFLVNGFKFGREPEDLWTLSIIPTAADTIEDMKSLPDEEIILFPESGKGWVNMEPELESAA